MHFLDTDQDYQDLRHLKKNKSSKMAGKRIISPRKSRKAHKKIVSDHQIIKLGSTKIRKHKKDKKVKIETKINTLNENNNKDNDKINIYDKPDNNDSQSDIYKFIIDHANESGENFDKMLKKEIKKVEHLKHNKTKGKKISSKKNLKLRPKRFNSVVFPKKRNTHSIFEYIETTKNLMKHDNIELSSISGESNYEASHKKKIKRKFGSIQINSNQIKAKIKKKMNKGIFNDKYNNFNSDKDSIISILSDLM